MSSVIQEISRWAEEELPYWEQVALDKLLAGETFCDEDYQTLLTYLLEDAGLVEKKSKRELIRFQKGFYGQPGPQKPVVLKEISHLENINALVPGQRLTFDPQLTVIFGRNGSGKSGYARVLGAAGFTRGDRRILPDIRKPQEEQKAMRVEIEVEVNQQPRKITYTIGKPCPELSEFYVFDSTSVQVHMSGKNEFSFSPAGLAILKDLVTITDVVRQKRDEEISRRQQRPLFLNYFAGDSKITERLGTINPNTSLQEIKKLAGLTDQEQRRLYQVGKEIAAIGLGEHKNNIEKMKKQLGMLEKIKEWLCELHSKLEITNLEKINAGIKQYDKLRQRAADLSSEAFHNSRLQHTGSDLWQQFVRVSHELAQAESQEGHSYPAEGDVCLLCQQPLSHDAKDLLLKLWDFVEGTARKELDEITEELNRWVKECKALLDFPGDISVLQEINAELYVSILPYKNRLHSEVEKIISGLEEKKLVISDFVINEKPLIQLKTQMDEIANQIQELEDKNPENQQSILEKEHRYLEHKQLLGEHWAEVAAYIRDIQWAQEASKAGGTTYHITRKYNELFEQLVKQRYLNLFQEMLQKLGRQVQVEVSTSGKKGTTVKQIVMKAHQTASKIAAPENVLSEGEKRAVALADFLTEVALDTSSNGIVLDDPVTSLDLEWRETIAKILAQEAVNRQVIVFTHDMPFLYLLMEHARQLQISVQNHWIKRESNEQPGYVYLNNSPALEREYRKATYAKQFLESARKAPADLQESHLKNGMGALRTSYEAFIIFDLFCEVVMRFNERISFGRLKEVVLDQSIVTEVIKNCEQLSRYIEGHLHSDIFATPLTTNLLEIEINKFQDLVKRHNELKNQVKKGK